MKPLLNDKTVSRNILTHACIPTVSNLAHANSLFAAIINVLASCSKIYFVLLLETTLRESTGKIARQKSSWKNVSLLARSKPKLAFRNVVNCFSDASLQYKSLQLNTLSWQYVMAHYWFKTAAFLTPDEGILNWQDENMTWKALFKRKSTWDLNYEFVIFAQCVTI